MSAAKAVQLQTQEERQQPKAAAAQGFLTWRIAASDNQPILSNPQTLVIPSEVEGP
jgi:hypothetical protein